MTLRGHFKTHILEQNLRVFLGVHYAVAKLKLALFAKDLTIRSAFERYFSAVVEVLRMSRLSYREYIARVFRFEGECGTVSL